MKSRSFVDEQHAASYLNGSMILYKEAPVVVLATYGRRSSLMMNLIHNHQYNMQPHEDVMDEISLDDKNIDMTPFQIGFINVKSNLGTRINAVKAFRSPRRMWKVGLTAESLVCPDGYPKSVIYTKDFTDTVINNFPTLEKALEKIEKHSKKVAFSRRFAIDSEEKLWFVYVDTPVGECNKRKIRLDKDYLYLTESLDQDIER